MTSSLPTGQTSLLLQMTQRLALSDAHFRRICQLIYQRAGSYWPTTSGIWFITARSAVCVPGWMTLVAISACWKLTRTVLSGRLLLTPDYQPDRIFREGHHFPVLSDHARRRSGEYRVWSAAASTGEEPYSIAITLADTLGMAPGRWRVLPATLIPKCWKRPETAFTASMS